METVTSVECKRLVVTLTGRVEQTTVLMENTKVKTRRKKQNVQSDRPHARQPVWFLS